MISGAMSRRFVRLAGVVALAGLTAACASDENTAMVAPAGYGKDDISRAERLVQYCDRLAAKGEMVTALGLCGRAHEIDPDNPETLMKVARILQSLERHQAAAQTYGVLLERHPGHQEARYSLGKLYMERGELSLAAMHFNQAIISNPDDPRPYNALGILRDQAGEHQAAQVLYRSSLEREPGNLSARNNLGLSLALSGQRDEAIEVLAELAVDPEADRTVLRNLEAAYASRALPAAGSGAPDEATAVEGVPAMTVPAAELPVAADPVEVKALDKRPNQPAPLPEKAPAMTAPTVQRAPTVEKTPASPSSGAPTPLYPPKPRANKQTPRRGIESRIGQTSAAPASPTTARQTPVARKPESATGKSSSAILAAAELLMQPPAWADFDPGAQPVLAPREPSVRRAPVQQDEVRLNEAAKPDEAKPEEVKPAAEPKSGTAKFNGLPQRSVFSSI